MKKTLVVSAVSALCIGLSGGAALADTISNTGSWFKQPDQQQ